MRHLFLIVAAAVVAAFSPAASQATNNPIAVVRKDFGSDERSLGAPLRITRLDVAVDIVGRSASTVITATVAQTQEDSVEGDFSLDLPAGSIVTGYALDVRGAMVDGVLIDRRTGQQAYENTVRRGVDPGLAEATATGDFHTRIFPIGGDAPRTIRVSFVTPLAPGADYDLPLEQTSPIGALSISVRSAGLESLPTVRGPGGLDLRWTGGASGVAQGSATKVTPKGGLLISGLKPSPVTQGEYKGQVFFDIAAPARAQAAMASLPVLRIFWDASLSRRDDDLAAETALLRAYLLRSAPRSIELVRFADGGAERTVHQGPAAIDDVVKAVNATRYFGATSYKTLFDQGSARDGATACLLFSDGESTIDDFEIRDLGCPVFAISSAKDARRDYLAVLAGKLGGAAVDLTVLDEATALERLTEGGERILAVTDANGLPIDYVALPWAGGWRVVGPAAQAGAVQVTTTAGAQTYSLSAVPSPAHPGAATAWAQAKLVEFAATAPPNDKTTFAFARHYSVAAPGLVFLVLETADDYAENEIEPPASLGDEVISEYREQVEAVRAEKEEARAARLGKVLALWEERKAWWNTRHRPAKPEAVRRRAFQDAAPTSTAAAPPPPPPAMQPRLQSSVVDSIVAEDVGRFPDRNLEQAVNRDAAVEDVIVVGARADTRPRRTITTDLAEWNPERPYLEALAAAPARRFDEVFATQQAEHGELPAFYFDVAEWLFQRGRKAEAVAMVMNVVELEAADTSTLALLALKLQRYGDFSRSIWVSGKILALEPDRPQPRRNLALTLIARASAPSTSPADQKRDLERALALLSEVVMTPWSDRYEGIEVIALMEANRVIPLARDRGAAVPLDERLIALLDVDLRVVLEWNTDHTDMDLWIDEPNGERVIYSDPLSSSGGSLSNDMTSGYGPEEYLLRRAPAGRYEIRADGYAEDTVNPNGATTARVLLYRNWGRATESVEVIDVELKDEDDATRVGAFTVQAAAFPADD